MTLIGRISSPAPTLDSNTSVSDAIEYLMINKYDHAFIQHESEMVGIVSSERLLEVLNHGPVIHYGIYVTHYND